jgi:hypothetical protein
MNFIGDMISEGAIALALVATAVVSFAVVRSGPECGVRWGWSLRSLVALFQVALAASLIAASRETQFALGAVLGLETGSLPVVTALGWLALSLSLLVAFLPQRLVTHHPWAVASLALAPMMVIIVAVYAVAPRFEEIDPVFGVGFSARDSLLRGIVSELLLVFTIGSVLLLWQALEGVRGIVKDAVPGVLSLTHSLSVKLLVALLVLKVVFVAVGYAGVLGADADLWASSRDEPLLSWVFAVGFVGVAALLLREAASARFSEHGIWRTAAVVVFVFIASSLVIAPIAAFLATSSLVPEGAFRDRLTSGSVGAIDWLGGITLTWQASVIFVSAAAAALLGLLGAGRRAITLYLGLLASWAGGRAYWALADPDLAKRHSAGVASLISVDTVVTVSVCMLVVLAWGGRRFAGRASLVAVAVASTLVAYVPAIYDVLPQAFDARVFYLGLAFPLLWQYVMDAERINERSQIAPAKLVAVIAIAFLIAAFSLIQTEIGQLTPDSSTYGSLARVVFALPLIVLLLASITVPRLPGQHAAVRGHLDV